ncbi:REV1 [Symbiodinium microadriaticum]|nr:REV1 [Symbiodinium microadriaticum]CAE7945272.1 REV1 [Symbiodinium sp. KB8]
MDRRGPLLKAHPMFNFLFEVSPKAVTRLCGLLKLNMFEDGELIFARYSQAKGMYIACTGTYMLSLGGKDSKTTVDGFEFYAEISLFMKFSHSMSLLSISFNDVFFLDPMQLADCLKDFPECCGFVYQYAKTMQSDLHSGAFGANDVIPLESVLSLCESTDAYKILNISERKTLEKFVVPACDQAKESFSQWLQRFLNKTDPENVASRYHMLAELSRFFPELEMENGSYSAFVDEPAIHRALSCMASVLWLVKDSFDEFSRPQKSGDKMPLEMWQRLQEFVRWTGVRSDVSSLYGTFVLIVARGLSKSKQLLWQFPEKHQQPDAAVTHMLRARHNVLPSAAELDLDMRTVMCKVSSLHQVFAIGQFMQGENTPLNIRNLQEELKIESDPAVFKIFLLSEFASLLGIGASSRTSGSSFLNKRTGRTVISSLHALQQLESQPCVSVYWNYLCTWARTLQLALDEPADFAFARLACICRMNDRNPRLKLLYLSWANMNQADRAVLTDFFLADGIRNHACVFSYLPACFDNAQKNPAVGFATFLDLLVELVEIIWMQMESNVTPRQPVLNLFDLAAFTGVVRSRSVFCSCLEHTKILHMPNGDMQLTMTSKNWSRTEEATDHPISVPSSLRQLVRRQNLHSRIVIEVPLNPTSESMEEEHNAVVSSQLV